ncbi:MAG TPA: lipocalin family protein [Dyella sp.]|uniref:lipocalin family protein n=1 Tax=Dyella sp. TaxID=1869338 RepID=UPI002C49B922|nr:lipocalin family protein [Dyella sp.]HUB90302.1 lipocalin family protein [Dyella sp.]
MHAAKKVVAAFGFTLASMGAGAAAPPPIQPVPYVDLTRFMGRWYVIASIPTRFERNAYNAVETYTLQPDGNVYTAFRFNNGGFDASEKSIHSLGIVKPGTGNAVWGVQLFWPLRAQYIVAYLSKDYGETIVARDARDYTWVMARTPSVSPDVYQALMQKVKSLGYDMSQLRQVPQRWPDKNTPGAGQ